MEGGREKEILALIEDDKSFDAGISLLISSYQEKLYWHIRRMVKTHENADDVLQNVFIKVFKNIKGFKGESKLYSWLYRIATNESLSFIKKQKVRTNHEGALALKKHPSAEPYLESEQTLKILKTAIDSLPDKQKLVFNLRYYDEMSYKEMSTVLDTSIGALKASFHHAVKKVETYLKENIHFNR